MRTAVDLWVSLMDNGLFELPTASASPTRDAGVDYSRRDRNDEDFRDLVRANEAKDKQAEAQAQANSDRRDSGREPQSDTFDASETVSQQQSDQDDHSVAETKQTDAPPVTQSDAASEAQAPDEAPEAPDTLSEVPAGSDSSEPAVEATAADTFDALLAAGKQNPAAAAATPPANPGSANTSSSAVPEVPAASTAAGASPTANAGVPEVIAQTGPTREPVPGESVNAPTKQAVPTPPPPQSPPADAPAKPHAPTETATNAPQTGTETSHRSGLAQFVEDATAQAQTAATQTSGDTETPTDGRDTVVTTNGQQTAGPENGKPGTAADAAELSSLAPPAAPVASAAGNGRTEPGKQTSSNAASNTQSPPSAFAPSATTPSGTNTQGAGAPPNPQTSAVREMALAAAADQLAPNQTLRSGDTAPDLAVFRETLATILPDATSAQTTDSARSAGRIVAAELGARPQLLQPSLTDQVSIRIREAFNAGDTEVRIQLQPKELGRIDVRMEITESGRMSALVVAERADTLDLLMRDARGLERALQQAGFDTDSNSLSFDLQGQDEQPGGPDHSGENTAAETTPNDAPVADEINIDLAALMNGDVSTNGVDIRV